MTGEDWLKLVLMIVGSAASAGMVVHGFASRVKTDIALLNQTIPLLTAQVKALAEELKAAELGIMRSRVESTEREIRNLRAWRHWIGGILAPWCIEKKISLPPFSHEEL